VRRLEGFYVPFSDRLDTAANARLHALNSRLLANRLPGVTDLFPAYTNLYVEFDAAQVGRNTVMAWVRSHLDPHQPTPSAGPLHTVPVRYDGEDLDWAAQTLGISVGELIERHTRPTYHVFAVGFVPGFPFMGPLDPSLYLPRRRTPRKKVPIHSVAMAVSQTAIYVLPTPGGWHLLGTALEQVYNPNRPDPFLLAPGQQVRFAPSQGPTPAEPQPLELLPGEPRHPVFRVARPGLLDLVMDEGRLLGARFGMARSGPMDARSARLANAAVGNPEGAPLLELTLTGPVLECLAPVVVGFAGFGLTMRINGEPLPGGRSVAMARGDRLDFQPHSQGARAYLALAGGIESQSFLGSQSTDLTGKVGRPLRSGDLLGVEQPRSVRAGFAQRLPQLAQRIRIRLLAGPQATPDALQALASGPFAVSSPDRMGIRLEGPKVPGGELISEATPMGAVQITTEGNPILLLNDRGRIGGYAKPAVVDPRDLPLVAQLRPGQQIEFGVEPIAQTDHWFLWP
jgi:KipI family sensor histidine kinase inhibitor